MELHLWNCLLLLLFGAVVVSLNAWVISIIVNRQRVSPPNQVIGCVALSDFIVWIMFWPVFSLCFLGNLCEDFNEAIVLTEYLYWLFIKDTIIANLAPDRGRTTRSSGR